MRVITDVRYKLQSVPSKTKRVFKFFFFFFKQKTKKEPKKKKNKKKKKKKKNSFVRSFVRERACLCKSSSKYKFCRLSRRLTCFISTRRYKTE